MQLAYMIETPDALGTMAWCWHDLPVRQILENIAEIGYDGVELQVRDPAAFDNDAFFDELNSCGLAVSALSCGAARAADKLYLIDPDPARRRAAIDRFKSILRLAGRYGCIGVGMGSFRGNLSWGPDPKTALDWFRSAIEEILPVAESARAAILLEPTNRYVCDQLNTIDETIAFIDSFGSPWLQIEGDVHHIILEERSIPGGLIRGHLSGKMTYLQLSDSNRCAPGYGSFNWMDIIDTLRQVGYDGWLSMEFRQVPDSASACRRAFETLRPLL
jgi:sugar phosphate isomerase/epimerase